MRFPRYFNFALWWERERVKSGLCIETTGSWYIRRSLLGLGVTPCRKGGVKGVFGGKEGEGGVWLRLRPR